MDKIILVGAGGHASSCIDVIELSAQYEIAGLVEKDNIKSDSNLGYPVFGTDEDLSHFRKKYEYALITVGQIKSAATRVHLFEVLSDLNYKMPTIISPRSHVSPHSMIGEGTIIMHDVIVNANAQIGKNCIINNKVLIEHDAVVGDHCHISTGAIVNGEVVVSDKSFLGSGVVTKQSITIGSNCVIGAGVVVKADIKPNQLIRK